MSVKELSLELTAGAVIYDPVTLATTLDVVVRNYGTTLAEDLGIYIVPASTLGDVDAPASYPPETDYQDLLTWGTDTDLGVTVSGGLIVTCDNGSGTVSQYVTRTVGSLRENKIPLISIPAGGTETITLEFEAPPSAPARRLYVNLVVE